MTDTAILRVKVDASGMVRGGREVEASLNGISRSAGVSGAAVAASQAASQGALAKTAAQARIAGASMAELAGKLSGAAVAATAIAAGLHSFAKAAFEAEENARKLSAAVDRKGASFGKSTAQLMAMATELERVTTFEDDAIQQAQAILLRFDEIDASNLEAVTRATLDFAQATGQAAPAAAVAFGKALLVPGEAMRALKEVGITLTQSQQDLVDTWNASGQSARSVSLLVGMMNDKIGGEAESAAQTGAGAIKQLTAALGNLQETLGSSATSGGTIGGIQLLIAGIRGIDASLQTGVGKRLRELASMPVAWTIIGETVKGWKEIFGGAESQIKAVKDAADKAGPSVAAIFDPAKLKSDTDAFGKALDHLVTQALEESAVAAKEFASQLQTILDEVDPVAAEVRTLEEKISLVSVALANGGPNVAIYEAALESLRAKLVEVQAAAGSVAQTIPLIEMGPRDLPTVYGNPTGGSVTVSQSPFVREMQWAEEEFTANLTDGMGQAAASFAREFIETGEINIQRLGDMLVDVLLSAAQQYFARMVANQAKLQMTGGSSGGGGWGSLFGSAGGMSSGFATFGAAIAVFAGAVALFKHESDRAEAVRYGTTAGVTTTDGIAQEGFIGRLNETGPAVAAAIGGLLNAFQTATGSFMEGVATAEVQIRNDKTQFRAVVNGIMVGQFATAEEAIIAAAKAAFLGGDLSRELDPIMRGLIANFKGDDVQALMDAMQSVQAIIDELSGISEVEIRLRELPARAAAMAAELVNVGVAFEDARDMSGRWRVAELQSIRDELTGRQQTTDELMAEQQRKSAMYNAEVTLFHAETQMKRDEVAMRVEVLRANGHLYEGQAELEKANLEFGRDVLAGKASLYDKDAELQQWYLTTMGVATNASLVMLEQQLAALDAMLENMPTLISPGEIRLPNLGGGGGGSMSAGPSEAEQRAEAFLDFLEQLRLDGLSGYQRALADLEAAFAEHARAAAEMEGGEERLAAARRQALADLREDVIDAFGSPMEGLRDRLAEIRQRVEDWYAANDALGEQFLAGEISLQQLMDALAESNQLWAEFGDMARSELSNLALYFTDAMGDTEESARIREELAEMEWDFKRLEMAMMIETYAEIGWLSQAAADHWRDFLDTLPENRPGNVGASGSGGGSGSLQSAIARLRNAIDALRESNENLLLSDVSPLSTADQFAEAERIYNETLAAAQGGDLQAIEDFASVRDQYLELAAAMYGTAGGGYQSIFQQSLQAGQDLATAGQAILDAIPPQMAGVEDRLDTIAEIQAAILAAMTPTGTTGGPPEPPPPPGHPPRPPRPGEGGDEYYPPGHPPRPPGHGGDPETIAELRAMNAQLRDLLTATEEQTRSANSNSLRRVATVGGSRGISVRRGN